MATVVSSSPATPTCSGSVLLSIYSLIMSARGAPRDLATWCYKRPLHEVAAVQRVNCCCLAEPLPCRPLLFPRPSSGGCWRWPALNGAAGRRPDFCDNALVATVLGGSPANPSSMFLAHSASPADNKQATQSAPRPNGWQAGRPLLSYAWQQLAQQSRSRTPRLQPRLHALAAAGERVHPWLTWVNTGPRWTEFGFTACDHPAHRHGPAATSQHFDQVSVLVGYEMLQRFGGPGQSSWARSSSV